MLSRDFIASRKSTVRDQVNINVCIRRRNTCERDSRRKSWRQPVGTSSCRFSHRFHIEGCTRLNNEWRKDNHTPVGFHHQPCKSEQQRPLCSVRCKLCLSPFHRTGFWHSTSKGLNKFDRPFHKWGCTRTCKRHYNQVLLRNNNVFWLRSAM